MPFSVTFFFFFNDTATTEIYTLSLHDALPIYDPGCWPLDLCCHNSRLRRGKLGVVPSRRESIWPVGGHSWDVRRLRSWKRSEEHTSNSSHSQISYAVFCLKKKKKSTSPPFRPP